LYSDGAVQSYDDLTNVATSRGATGPLWPTPFSGLNRPVRAIMGLKLALHN